MKRIVALFLAFSMMLSLSAMAKSDAANIGTVSEEAEFLQTLGIADSKIINSDDPVTRAEYTHMLVKAMNMEEMTVTEDMFADVTDHTAYAGSIAAAAFIGLVSGSGSVFMPDEAITAEAALKMAVLALGYNDVAAAYGGYPTGYIRVANEIGLTDGADISKGFGKNDVIMLLYNFLETDLCLVESVNDETVTVKRDMGKTPLSHWFEFSKDEGVARTAGYASMVQGYDSDKAVIYVNGASYTTNIENSEKYLGMSITVWYDKSKNVKAIYVNEDNSSVSLSSDNIESAQDNVIVVFDSDSGKEKKYVLDPAYTFVKNGRSINPTYDDFLTDCSEFTFIDNNGDKKYDVVLAYIPEYIVVSYINAVEGIVFDTNGSGKQLLLDEESGIVYSLTKIDKDGIRTPMYMEELSQNDVIKYYISEDGTLVSGEVFKGTVNGKVTEKRDNNEVVINDTVYKTNSYFGDASRLEFGVDYTLLIASDNTITLISPNQTGNMQYGFLLEFEGRRTGLKYQALIRILATNKDIIETELADEIVLDGKKGVAKDSDEVVKKLKNPKEPTVTNYSVIRYCLDSDNKVCKIDTPVNLEDSEYSLDKLIESSVNDDSLTRHLNKKNVFYHGAYAVFAPNAIIGPSTVFISVPTDFDTSGAGPAKKYDKDDFSIITSANLQSYETLAVTMYDINKNFEPAVVLMYKGIGSGGTNAPVSNNAAPAIVKDVTYGYNENGDATAIVSYFQGKRSYKLPINSEKYVTLKPEDLPKKGDIIRMTTDKYGEIANFKIDIRYTPSADGKSGTLSTTSQTVNGGLGNDMIYFGKSYYHSPTSLSMLVMGGKANGHDYLANASSFQVMSNCSVVVYNMASGMAQAGSMGMLADALAVGEENASLIAVKCYSHQVSSIFIYQ